MRTINRGSDRGLGVSREEGRLHGGSGITLGIDTKPDLAAGAWPWRVFTDAMPCPVRSKTATGAKRLDKGWRLVLGAEERMEGNVVG